MLMTKADWSALLTIVIRSLVAVVRWAQGVKARLGDA
jgi:hypothetical protein